MKTIQKLALDDNVANKHGYFLTTSGKYMMMKSQYSTFDKIYTSTPSCVRACWNVYDYMSVIYVHKEYKI